MNNNEITQVQELLKSVGLNTFINYYYDFQQNLSIEDLLSLFDKNENWTLNSKNTKAFAGKKIFQEELNFIALFYIVNLAKKVDIETKSKAKIILESIRDSVPNKDLENIEILSEEDFYWLMKDIEDENNMIH